MNLASIRQRGYFRRLTRKRLIVITALIGLGTVSLVVVASNVHTQTGLATLDQPVLSWVAAHRSPALTAFMHGVTDFMSPPTLLVAIVLGAGIWALRNKEYWRPLLLVGAFGGSFGLSTALKLLTERNRPPATDMLLPLETSYSFPSNHVFGVAVCVLVLGYLLYSRRQSARRLYLWLGTSFALICLVSASRMYLGYHWLTDVTAAACLALVILGLVIILDTFGPITRQSN